MHHLIHNWCPPPTHTHVGSTHWRAEVDVGISIPRVHISQLDELAFATSFVAHNKPCIIVGRSWRSMWLIRWMRHGCCEPQPSMRACKQQQHGFHVWIPSIRAGEIHHCTREFIVHTCPLINSDDMRCFFLLHRICRLA